MRRLLEQLEEATYARDADLRARAERFYQDLRAYLDVPEDELRRRLIPGRDGSFSVWARDFLKSAGRPGSSDTSMDDLIVVFGPAREGRKAGVGTFRGSDALVIYALLAPGDPRFLADRVVHEVVVHEVIHLLDPGRRSGHGGAHAMKRGGMAAYYNEPSEWNAYWQEGAAQLERLLHKMSTPGRPEARSKAFDHFFGDGSLRALQDRVGRFWDPDFLEAMDPTTRRKFDKRLATLWTELRAQGRLS